MKKSKILIAGALAAVLFINISAKKAYAAVSDLGLQEYSSLYDTSNVKVATYYDADYRFTDVYLKYDYPMVVNLKETKKIYFSYNSTYLNEVNSDFTYEHVLVATIDNNQTINIPIDKTTGKLNNTNCKLIDEQDTELLYEIDFSSLGDHYITNISIYRAIPYNQLTDADSYNVSIDLEDYSSVQSSDLDYSKVITTDDAKPMIYFDNNYNMSNDYYMVDSIDYSNNKLDLYLINTYVSENLKSVVIDSTTYPVSIDSEDSWHYVIENFTPTQKTYNLTKLNYAPTGLTDTGTTELLASKNVNENFTYTETKKYVETAAITQTYESNPLIGFTETFAWTALFNSVHGRIDNAKQVNLRYDYSKKSDMKNIEKRSTTYDIDNSGNPTKLTTDGNVRKLVGDERFKAGNYQSFTYFDKLAINITGIDLAKFEYDYEFKVRGYVKDRNIQYTSVVYEVEEGSVYYGSMYKDALNWDASGIVYNGNGEVQENLHFNGTDVVNTETGETIEPEFNSVISPEKGNFFKDLMQAASSTADNYKSAVEQAIDSAISGAKKSANLIAVVIGGLLAVVFFRVVFSAKKD